MTDEVQDVLPRVVTGVAQDKLIRRAKQVLSRDERVLGVWLTGSYGRGTNDEFSDVDLLVVVTAHNVADFCADWPRIVGDIAPTVIRKQLPGMSIFNQVSEDWVRFDVTVLTPDELSRRTVSTVRPIHDPRGLSSRLAEPGTVKLPDPVRVAALTQEFFRVLGLLPVVVGREEYVVAEKGSGLVLAMLCDLMLEDATVEDRGGALHLNRLLPQDRRQTLLDLPPLTATRASAIEFHLACAKAFIPLARDLHSRCDLAWPQPLEAALRRHLLRTLSVTIDVPVMPAPNQTS